MINKDLSLIRRKKHTLRSNESRIEVYIYSSEIGFGISVAADLSTDEDVTY